MEFFFFLKTIDSGMLTAQMVLSPIKSRDTNTTGMNPVITWYFVNLQISDDTGAVLCRVQLAVLHTNHHVINCMLKTREAVFFFKVAN